MRRFLALLHEHPGWTWSGVLAYAALATFPHESVQWFVNEIAIRITHPRLYQAAGILGIIVAVIATSFLFRRLARVPERRTIAVCWILTLGLIFGIWRAFTANNVELVHYPQYFPEGAALTALTFSPVESLAWVVLFGGLDEANQYAFLRHGRPAPLDFNDIYMDLAGGAAGMVFAMGFLDCKRRSPGQRLEWQRIVRRPGVVVLLSTIGCGILLWISGRMVLYEDPHNLHSWFTLSHIGRTGLWYRNPTWGPNLIHELSPVEGPSLIVFTMALYAILDRRFRLSPPEVSLRDRP